MKRRQNSRKRNVTINYFSEAQSLPGAAAVVALLAVICAIEVCSLRLSI